MGDKIWAITHKQVNYLNSFFIPMGVVEATVKDVAKLNLENFESVCVMFDFEGKENFSPFDKSIVLTKINGEILSDTPVLLTASKFINKTDAEEEFKKEREKALKELGDIKTKIEVLMEAI